MDENLLNNVNQELLVVIKFSCACKFSCLYVLKFWWSSHDWETKMCQIPVHMIVWSGRLSGIRLPIAFSTCGLMSSIVKWLATAHPTWRVSTASRIRLVCLIRKKRWWKWRSSVCQYKRGDWQKQCSWNKNAWWLYHQYSREQRAKMAKYANSLEKI